HFRGHDDHVSMELCEPYTLTATDGRYDLSCGGTYPTLRMTVDDGRAGFTVQPERVADLLYRVEESRGYEYKGALHSPG
ncbi:hypothetical protein, partial [Escherichia coli]|uniref:hypothetical protein n=1 Tax=Escherichia coli TaxID=562 RepID=UPI00389150BB